MDAKRKCVVVLVLFIILVSYFTVVTLPLVFIFKRAYAMKDQNINDFGLNQNEFGMEQKQPF